MGKIGNTSFFKEKFNISQQTKQGAGEAVEKADEKPVKIKKSPIKLNEKITLTLRNTIDALEQCGCKGYADGVRKIFSDSVRERFSVAVVGEFNRGKSTFINRFIGRDILPVGDLPTTAMMTRIRPDCEEKIILVDKNGQASKTLPVDMDSWTELTADNFGGKDPDGVVFVGVNSPWLYDNNVEIIDTPGAGDLEEKRAQVIGDALLRADGAIIAISATAALSISEKLFIEQRLITRKTPFLMIAVTKLDQIPLEQRSITIEFILNKLSLWNMDIPVFIPYDIEMPDDRYADIIGLDKIRDSIVSWINAPERVKLTEDWIIARTVSMLEMPISSLKEQLLLLDADDDKLRELIEEKKKGLSKAEIAWENLRLQLLEKCNECYDLLEEKAEEYKGTITERLQYEASHSNNPQKWWKEDYPYRMKIELTNMAVGIENVVSRQVAEDVKWFNMSLEQTFKSHVLFEKDTISDKKLFKDMEINRTVELENIEKQRALARIGTTALTLAGAFAMSAFGMFVPIATMGIGTGAGIITEKIFRDKIEKQQEAMKAAIAKIVPDMVNESLSDSERRLKSVYDGVLDSAVAKEKEWIAAQKLAIENSMQPKNKAQREKLEAQLKRLEVITDTLEGI